jgi:hypothetical protein
MKDFRLVLFLVVLTTGGFLFGCGSEEAGETERTAVPDEEAQVGEDGSGKSADWLAVEAMVDEVITRLRYQDKSGLYENEFQYLRDEENFDEYLRHGEVTWANANDLDSVEVRDITFFDRDSAWVEAVFHVRTADGKPEKSPQMLYAYYHQGRWIKPYMSDSKRQYDYEERIRQADEDSRDDSW